MSYSAAFRASGAPSRGSRGEKCMVVVVSRTEVREAFLIEIVIVVILA